MRRTCVCVCVCERMHLPCAGNSLGIPPSNPHLKQAGRACAFAPSFFIHYYNAPIFAEHPLYFVTPVLNASTRDDEMKGFLGQIVCCLCSHSKFSEGYSCLEMILGMICTISEAMTETPNSRKACAPAVFRCSDT